MNNKMITMSYADGIEYTENTEALFKALWELTDLIRQESELKKHHRAYLHVREAIDEKVTEARKIMIKVCVDMIELPFKVKVSDCEQCDKETPFADTDESETVTISKEDYDCMIDDLLTMSEIIQMVSGMRTQDEKALHKLSEYIPDFASYEHNRLCLYREAEKEAEEIFDRWADCVDEDEEDDYEPEEYFSD